MKTLGRKICCLLLFWGLLSSFVFSVDKENSEQAVFSWDFSDCEIRDILYVLSLDTGISIVPDDTVSGKGDFRFTGKDFERAFDSFLNSARLFVCKEDEVWTVSRFRLIEQEGLFSLDVCDLSAEQIVEKLSGFLGRVITYELLPAGNLSMHFRELSESDLLESVCLRLNGYELKKNDLGYHLAKKNNFVSGVNSVSGFMDIHKTEMGNYYVDVKDCRVCEFLEEFFVCAEDEELGFCLLGNGETRIVRSCFTGKDFNDTLDKICAQNGLSYFISDGVCYVLNDSTAGEELIKGKKSWFKLMLEYTKAEKFVSILNRRFGKIETIVLPDEMSLLLCASEQERTEIEALKMDVDLKTDTYLIELKFIRPDELVKYLPPGVDKECLFFADDNSGVYFKGTEASYLSLCEQLKICDRPVVRLSYDLLILQYDEGKENSWNPGFSIGKVKLGDRNDFGVKLGNVLNLNLNVISAFGLDFAAQLQTSLEENKTSVFADTTLHGVAGKQINFQNTNTYRYRDNNLDPDTGKPVYTGITKEIVSGLKLEVVGFVSGEGLITSSVTASVTRQGLDSSSSTGNPPPTSEKLVTTEVCGKSGEPIVISGLVQNSSSSASNGLPLLSKIPLIGKLFKSQEKIVEKTQMIIYLVPHIEDYAGKDISQQSEDWLWEQCDLLAGEIYEKL